MAEELEEALDIQWVAENLLVGVDAVPSMFGDSGEDGVQTDENGRQYIRVSCWTEDGQILGYQRIYVTITDDSPAASPDAEIAAGALESAASALNRPSEGASYEAWSSGVGDWLRQRAAKIRSNTPQTTATK